MTAPRESFQEQLQDMFQFKLSDLDFGIHRFPRLKNDELGKGTCGQVPQMVEKAVANPAKASPPHGNTKRDRRYLFPPSAIFSPNRSEP